MESTRREIIDRLKDLTQPTGQEEQLEVDYPDARVHIPIKQALAVAGVIVVVIAAWVLIGGRDSSDASFAADGEFAAVAAVPSSEEAAGELVVSVVGAVSQPELLTLPAGSRVADALAQVQTLPEADLVALNQAQLLVDGQQVVVPAVGAPAGAGAVDAGGSKVSLNSADAVELTTLNGVGEATAAAIIAHRESIGGFTALEQLLDVKGIGPAKYEKISGDISL